MTPLLNGERLGEGLRRSQFGKHVFPVRLHLCYVICAGKLAVLHNDLHFAFALAHDANVGA